MHSRVATRLIGLVLVAGATTATSCGWWLTARAPLTPPPAFDCITSTLSAQSEVRRMDRPWHGHGREGVDVDLSDSSTTHAVGASVSRSLRRVPGDTIFLSIAWGDRKRPSEAEIRAAATFTGRLVDELRSRCAPQSPREIMCEFGGEPRSCPPVS